MNDHPHLRLLQVCKSYSSSCYQGEPIKVLNNISLDIQFGESIAIQGPSGSGKSTLLNLMAGLDRPSSGRVLLAGENLSQLDENQICALRRVQIGFVFQQHQLLPQLSLRENVLLPLLASDSVISRDGIKRAEELLQWVGLEERANHRPANCSGGECQRAALARALIRQPPLLLADEPTGSLDSLNAEKLAELLARINQERGVTVITVTHSSQIAQAMQTTYCLKLGDLVQSSSL